MVQEQPPPAGRGRDGLDSRQRIFETAIRLFARQGYAATGVREIAGQAEVNLAMINYFFGSKLELLKAILDDFFAGYLKLAEESLAGPDPVESKIRRFIKAAIAYFAAHQDQLIITLTEMAHDEPEVTEFKAAFTAKLLRLLETHVYAALARASDRPLPLGIIGPAAICAAMSHFLFRPVITRVRPQDFDESFLAGYQELMAEFCLHGLVGLFPGLVDEGAAHV